MKMPIIQRMKRAINRRKGEIILKQDFVTFESASAVSGVLKKLVCQASFKGFAQRNYVEGRTDQIPMTIAYEVFDRRISRKLRIGLNEVLYENNRAE